MKILSSNIIRKANLVIAFAFFSLVMGHAQGLLPVSAVNSPFDEIHPSLSPGGDLYFTRAFHPQNTSGAADRGDIWYGPSFHSESFQAPMRIASLSTSGFDLVLGFPDDSTIYVYHSHLGNVQGIFEYRGHGEHWRLQGPLDIPGFRNFSTSFSGRLSTDGQVLVFSMKGFDSHGNEDLYISRKLEEGKWSNPIHLGPDVNTRFQELTPFLSQDQKVLFFSSNGHGDTPQSSVYFSMRLDDSFERWSSPSLVSVLGSEGVTLAFFRDGRGKRTFLTSTSSSEGYGDIFVVSTEAENSIMAQVQQQSTLAVNPEPASPALSEMIDVVGEPEVSKPTEMDEAVSSSPSEDIPDWIKRLEASYPKYRLSFFIAGDSSVDVRGSDQTPRIPDSFQRGILLIPGYLPVAFSLADMPYLTDSLIPVESGKKVVLENIQFERGSAELVEEHSLNQIDAILTFMTQNPQLKIVLEGHTDNFGNAQLNKELSLKRAGAIRAILVEKGVSYERIRVNGYGGSRPIASNQSENGRILNRRVELVVLEK